MAFDNPSNRGRADKIAEIVAHVKKSAQSNKATPEEIAEIMAPAVEALREIGAVPAEMKQGTAHLEGIQAGVEHAVSVETWDPPNAIAQELRRTPEVRALRAGQRAALHLTSKASMRDLICALMGKLEAQAETFEAGAEEGA